MDVLSHAAHFVWQVEPLPDFRQRRSADYSTVTPDDPRLTAVLATMARKGTALDATRYVARAHPDALAFSAQLVRLARAAGVSILAGTDAIGAPIRAVYRGGKRHARSR